MAKYVKVTGGYVEYDFTTRKAAPFTKAQAQADLAAALAELAEIPPMPTDDELLAWARVNYPVMDYSREIELLNKTITLCNARLAAITVLENKI